MSRSTPPRPVRPWVRAAVFAVAIAGLAAAALVEGSLTGRWGASADLRAASAKLDGVPKAFGDWTSDESPIADKVLQVAEATGHVSRVYRHSKNRAELSVLLLCGPSGPIGAHTPEVCYAGNGFARTGSADKKVLALPGGATASYWSARFEKAADPGAAPLRVCWMWGTGGDWEAATNPRLGLRSALYKLYVVRSEPQPTVGETDPVTEFLTAFLPEVKKAIGTEAAAQ
jgi:hypothetical protein